MAARSNTLKNFCPHCGENVSRKTYLAHKRIYFDCETDSWIKRKKMSTSDDCFDAVDFEDLEKDDQGEITEVDVHGLGPPPIVDFEDETLLSQEREYEFQECEDVSTNFVSSDSEENGSDEDVDEEEIWEKNDSEEEDDLPVLEDATQGNEMALLTWLLLFLLRMQAKHYIPDVALNSLLKFLYAFLLVLGRYSEVVQRIASVFPKSMYQLQSYFKLTEEFTRFVVCRKCYSVYEMNACMEHHGTVVTSKHCSYRTHPNSRSVCHTLLLKTVILLGGKKKLYPFKVYCYSGFQRSLQRLLNRPGFADLCDHWRSRTTCDSSSTLQDIYDGQLWKDFLYQDGQPCLAARFTYAVMLNIDWFQPYIHTTSSVGAIYLTVMNLPYQHRFKRENVILLGIIPGPGEPRRDINQYLRPFVKEMLQYSTGVIMNVYGQTNKQIVRCILFGVACDLPAGRKTCGFLGHSAHHGCARCLKTFPGSPAAGSMDYSGFDRENWKSRTNSDHRAAVRRIQRAKTKTMRDQLESEYGCRYSVLLELSYFDPVRMLLIDPMHNLFLGSAKHMVKNVWSSSNVLDLSNKKVNQVIQDKIDSIQVPSNTGRIPRKIETGFSGLTADQFKNWVTLYSVPCLYGVMDSDDLECWRHFVLACRILCQQSLTLTDVNLADILLLQFCCRVQRMYGNNVVTPNMHMHCHLKEVLLDYGPVYGFWLFSYERYNGILQHQPSSNRCVEPQIMKRFLQDNTAYAFQPPAEFHEEFGELCTLQQRMTGSLLLMSRDQSSNQTWTVELPSVCTRHKFAENEQDMLKRVLLKFHSPSEDVNVNLLHCRYKYVLINKSKLISSTTKKTLVVMADSDSDRTSAVLPRDFTIPADPLIRACKVNQFVKVSYSFTDDGQLFTHCFAHVSWYQQHPSRFLLGKPVQLWCPDLFESHSFLSLDRTYLCQCVHYYHRLSDTEENVLAVIPCHV